MLPHTPMCGRRGRALGVIRPPARAQRTYPVLPTNGSEHGARSTLALRARTIIYRMARIAYGMPYACTTLLDRSSVTQCRH